MWHDVDYCINPWKRIIPPALFLRPLARKVAWGTTRSSGMLPDDEELVIKLNNRFSQKQMADLCTSESVRKKNVSMIISMLFLQHPRHLAPLPLMIYNSSHRKTISRWTLKHRGFDVLDSVHPSTDEPTGMASNTHICQMSRYFLQRVSPYVEVADIFCSGTG